MKHYQKNFENMMLRDYFALDRTKLANERTLLGYIRSFIGSFVAGLGLIQFTSDVIFIWIGFAFCFVSPLFLIIGTYRYVRLKKELDRIAEMNLPEQGDMCP